jgi:hypothetical protein
MSAFAPAYGYTEVPEWATSATSQAEARSLDSLDCSPPPRRSRSLTLSVTDAEYNAELVGERVRVVVVKAPREASFSFADALTSDFNSHGTFWSTPSLIAMTEEDDSASLSWELDLGSAPSRPGGVVNAMLRYGGRGKPLIYDDPDAE